MIYQGDCLEVLKTLPDNSIDSCVTDPPYGLSREPDIVEVLTKWLDGEDYHHRGGGFMGKTWDSFVPGPSIWREVYRVLKPGAHVFCFAGTRTQDLMTISLRLAGFEIRDVVEWLYFQGFPKSMDVGKAFDKRAGAKREVIAQTKVSGGLGTFRLHGFSTLEELKEAAERGEKCPDGRDARLTYKRTMERLEKMGAITAPATELAKKWDGWGTALKPAHEPIILARKPLDGTVADNVERWGTGALNIDGCRIPMRENEDTRRNSKGGEWREGSNTFKIRERHVDDFPKRDGRFPANCVTTEPDAFFSKYFNVTPPELSKKASKRDRNSDWQGREIGLDVRPTYGVEKAYGLDRFNTKNRNNHPTVKPTDLMAWLVRLVTPPGGVVLDPFAGSGSTLVAAKREGFDFIGIEREKEYVEIAKARTGSEVVEVKDEKSA